MEQRGLPNAESGLRALLRVGALAALGLITGAAVGLLVGGSGGPWQVVESGLWVRELRATADSGELVRLQAFRVDLATHRLEPVEARARAGRKMARVDELARESQALVAVTMARLGGTSNVRAVVTYAEDNAKLRALLDSRASPRIENTLRDA